MSEYIWEEIVQTYLTTNRAVLVTRQCEITDTQGWKMCPDLLALDFRAHRIWFVEVSTASKTSKIENKAKQFNTEIVPRLKEHLAKFAIIPDASHWTFGLWAFVRKGVADKLRSKVTPLVSPSNVEIQDLETIAFSWTYWDKRRTEENVEDN
jgi:hypothetical protein